MVKRTLEINFSETELTCRCGCGLTVKDEAIIALQNLRQLVGKPLVIKSSARCAAHNMAEGGSSGSMHVQGTAFDIQCHDSKLRAEITKHALACGFNGIGKYLNKNIVHVDIRDELTEWVH